MILSTARWE
ncbi:unnamed protein product [Linum tenue]|uniref:Uncharacterized protein n=1 Tax=Linum tenue TaxID=586396 RepID=A0AAV0L235_9ROSI|nr:unnamed protein product [Linum tenue]